ncbi:MAG: GNAT family N-acetyltransferase [Pseudomonadota bacterium]|jgi:hypothetical protein
MPEPDLTLEAVPAAARIPAADWDACANPAGQAFNPFVSHAFFAALEASGSASARTGWGPRHLVARLDGAIVGIVPCYLKAHSQGEYVFDHGWADAFERAGGRYYPKLQATVPFTPASGPRLLIRDGADRDAIGAILARGLIGLCDATDASSVHVTFAQQQEWERLAEHGFLQRTDRQFHWHNEGYASFEDFLGNLASRHRKAIRRERRDALAAGITIHHLTGDAITEEAWDAYFEFYMETGSRKWGRPYLNRKFYAEIGETMRERVLLVMAKRADRWIAGAINFIGSDTLFGRNWGAIEHHPFLHFEVCYYQAIDYAIANRLTWVEAGAQGEHKVARGYLPQTTYSAHYIPDPGFRRAVREYLAHERAHVADDISEMTDAGPFRKADADQS